MSEFRYDLMSGRYAEVGGGEAIREDVPPHVSCEGMKCGAVALEEDAESEGWVRCDNCESWYCPSCRATETTDAQSGRGADYPLCTACDEQRVEDFQSSRADGAFDTIAEREDFYRD